MIDIHPAATSFARSPDGWAEVPFRVTNIGGTSVLLTSRCGDHLTPAIERRTVSGWELYAGGFCQAIYSASPVPLAAGARRDDVTSVADPGEYRLVLGTEHGWVASVAFAVR
jgi:hypothetical protein